MIKIFIVDDSPIILDRLKAMISEIPETEIIGEAGDAPEAIRAIQKLNPDMVVLDIKMPGGNGMDVLKNIKKNKSESVVVMLTNYHYPQYKRKCMDLGADFFLMKSTEFEMITDIIKKNLRTLRVHNNRSFSNHRD